MTTPAQRLSELPTDWLLCDDCSSTVRTIYDEQRRILATLVDHSPTCPAWASDEPEVALAMLPPSKGQDTTSPEDAAAALAWLKEQRP